MSAPMTFGDIELSVVVTSPPWYVNCYVLRHKQSGRQLVVDPGGDAERIARQVAAGGGGLEAILLTHGHPDHIGGVAELQQAYPVGCQAHAEEQSVIERAGQLAAMLTGETITVPHCVLFDGEPTLELAGMRLRVLHMPGHTPGGVCYVGDGFALTGDTLFEHGIGRTDLPGGDSRKLTQSITRLLRELDEDTVLFSGHGPSWTVGEAREWWQMMM